MKKGFTLIELLAVIVILAIIAVIAVPIVITIINDSADSTTLRSGEFYLDAVETAVMKKNMDTGGSFNPEECSVMGDGNLSCAEDKIKVDVDGERPIGGNIYFVNGKIDDATLTYLNDVISLDFNHKFIFGEDTLANYIRNLYKETKTAKVNDIEYSLDEKNFLMYDRLGSKDVDKLDGNIRYYGANPNNYIDIGDRDSNGNIIFWRILGVFKNMEVADENGNVIGTEDLVKIIRADKLTSDNIDGFSWDYTSAGTNAMNWKTATLQIMLNNAYYNSGTTSYYNNSTTPVTLNFTSTGLSIEAHDKIELVNWKLASYGKLDYVDKMYISDTKNGVNTWPGKVALVNVSDYGYTADLSTCNQSVGNYNTEACKTTTWLFDSVKTQWSLISNSWFTSRVHQLASNGSVGSNETYYDRAVRPTMYLKSDVSIKETKKTTDGLTYYVIK